MRASWNGREIARKAVEGAVSYPHLPRPHLGGKEEAQRKRHGHAVARGDASCEGERFLRENGKILRGAKDAFDLILGNGGLLFDTHDEARRHPLPEGDGDAHARFDILFAGIIEYLIDIAVGDVYDDFGIHLTTRS